MGIEMKYVTFFVVLAAFVLAQETNAATYVVGDSLGWTIPSGGAAAYATWASKNKYVPGDILVFNYAAGVHDVATVTKAAYNSCSSTSPLTLQTVSPSNITLTTAGTYYFICTFGQHCSLGQKLTLTVGSTSAATPSTSPPTSAATPPPTSAATPPASAATPPSTSAATPPASTATSPTTAATPPPVAAATPTVSPAAAPTIPPTASTSSAPGAGAPASVPTATSGGTPAGAPASPGTGGTGDSAPPPSAATRKGITMLVVVFGIVVMGAIF